MLAAILLARDCASGRQELHVRSPTATRDFIDVRDVARALLVLAQERYSWAGL